MRNQVAIEVTNGLSVLVTFVKNNVTRMTRQGMQNTSDISCFIYGSGTMEFMGAGVALRAPEDKENDDTGLELAFARAVKNAFPYDKEARTILHQVFRGAKGKVAPVKEPVPQKKLIIPFEDLFRETFEYDDDDDADDYYF